MVACCLAAVGVLLTACSSTSHGKVGPPSSTPAVTSSSATSSSAAAVTTPAPTPTTLAASTKASPTPTHTATGLSAKQVLEIAFTDAKNFSSYNYQFLQSDFARVESEMTPAFKAEYAKTTSELAPLIEKSHAVATVGSITGSVRSFTATAEVDDISLVQHVRSSNRPDGEQRQRMTVTLQRQPDGRWLLAALQLNP